LALWTHREPKPNRSLLNNPGNGTLRIHQILSEDLSFYSCAEAMLGHPEHFGKRPNVGGFLSSAFCQQHFVPVLIRRRFPLMALFGHAEVSWRFPLLGEQRKTFALIELFRF